jgi:putative PEP-CTERM system histidine kinase
MNAAVDLGLVAALVTAILFAALALHLGRLIAGAGGKWDPGAKWLLVATGLSAAWATAEALFLGLGLRSLAHAAVAMDLVRYAAWFGFLLALLRPDPASGERSGRPWLAQVAGLLLVLAGIARLALLIQPSHAATWRPILLGSSLGMAAFGLLLVEQLFRNQSQDGRWNAKLACTGLGIGFLFDLYLHAEAAMFGRYDPGMLQARPFVHAMAVPLLFISSKRHRTWIQNMRVSQAAVFYSASLLLVGGYLLFVAAAGYYVRYAGGSWGGALQVTLLSGAALVLVLILLSGTLRSRLRVFVGKHFFRYRYDHRQEWLRFTARLSGSDSPQEISLCAIQGLADLVESPGGSLWSRGLDDDRFVESARWNVPAHSESIPASHSFSAFILERDWVIDLKEFRNHPSKYSSLTIPLWLVTDPAAWLVIPLPVGEELFGFVVLTQPRAPVDLNWEVRDLVKTAARQAAAFLAHVHATAALLESRKLDDFNRMSAFVVHDLKNIVTQLSLMLKNAERHSDNPEFQQDMMLTVRNSVEKMRQLILQLREGQPAAQGAVGVNLSEVLHRLQQSVRAGQRNIELEIVERPVCRGEEARVERVIGHVIQNSLDATPVTGRVRVRLLRVAGRAVVEVIDNGVGMTQEFIRTRLYRPFNTTKAAGMGIGAYESYRYLNELGGSIVAESELGQGTTVVMQFPLMETMARSDRAGPERAGASVAESEDFRSP